ncbi:MAG: hypothetical protein QXZ43_01465 [Candidatus Aenigmatarchaeota archaeon]
MKIIFDTNSLIYSIKYKIDIFKEIEKNFQQPIELSITESVLKELDGISRSKKQSSVYARLSIHLIEKNNIKILPSRYKYTDRDILNLADRDSIVITNDKNLKELLKKRNIRTLSIREFKKIEDI